MTPRADSCLSKGATAVGNEPATLISRILSFLCSKPCLVIVDQIFVSAGSFLTAVLVGRAAGPSQLAIYGLAVTILWLMCGFPNSAIWVPHTNSVARLRKRSLRSMELSAKVQILIFVGLLAVPSCGFAYYINDLTWFSYLSIHIYLAGMVLREHMRRMNMARKQITALLTIDVPTAILQVLVVFSLAYQGLLTSQSALLVVGAITIVPFLGTLFDRALFIHPIRKTYINFRRHWRLGGWLVGASLLGSFTELTVRVMIVNLTDLASLGRFTAAATLTNLLNPLILTSGNYLLVTMANRYSTQGASALARLYASSFRYFIIAGVILFGLIACFGEWASSIIFGSQFQGLGSVIASGCLAILLAAIFIVLEAMLLVFNKGYDVFRSVCLRLAVTSFMGFVLIRNLGPVGANLAIAAGYFAAICFQMRKIRTVLTLAPVILPKPRF